MYKVLSGIVAAGLCCAILSACGGEPKGLSVTGYGRVEEISGSDITLQPGNWQNDAFVADGTSPRVTVEIQQGLSLLCLYKEDATLEDLQVGTVVKFTVTAEAQLNEEQITHLEIVQQPG